MERLITFGTYDDLHTWLEDRKVWEKEQDDIEDYIKVKCYIVSKDELEIFHVDTLEVNYD